MSVPETVPAPIGLFDSGLGGLTVLRELVRSIPEESYIYLGDNARMPYGTKSEETIRRYARECSHFLLAREVKLIVVACNTVSSVALQELQNECRVPVLGVIQPAVREALAATKSGRIAVLGTDATIANGAYQRALLEARPDAEVVSRACPLFVPIVEQGLYEGAIVEAAMDLYLSDIRSSTVDTVILGCTHYPLLAAAIDRYFEGRISIVECGRAVAKDVAAAIGDPASGCGAGSRTFFITDKISKFDKLARTLLADESLKTVHVEGL